ncbi:MAG: hypothetical protein IKW68_03715 [Clostridia bacterium]|nr:hypothetical protein [Clostridia bacterium]
MTDFSFKRVFTAVKNNFRINRSIPLLIFILTAIIMFLSVMLPVANTEDSYVVSAVNPEMHSWYVSRIEDTWDSIMGVNGIQAVCAIICAIGTALLSSISLTAYSRDKKGCDFWHSQPLTRREHLTANLVSGLIYYAVAIVPTWIISLAVGHMFTTVPPFSLGHILIIQLPVLLFLLLFYLSVLAVGMLCGVIAGSVMSILVCFATLLGYPALMIVFAGVVSNDIFNTPLMDILEHNYSVFAYSSPVLRYFFSISEIYALKPVDYILYLIFTVVVVALLFVIVPKRRNELSQEAVVFPVVRYPLQYVWTFLFSLFFAWMLYNMIWSPIWFVIGAVIGLILSFMILNMIFERSFTGLFKKPKHLGFCALLFVVLGLVFVADVFGIYKQPQPDIDKAYSFSAYYYENEYEYKEDVKYYEWLDVWSDSNIHELNDRDREMLERLWDYLKKEQNADYYSGEGFSCQVNLTIYCKNDPTSWRIYQRIENPTPELYEILDYLSSRFVSHSNEDDVEVEYYDEKTTVTAVPDGGYSAPELSDIIESESIGVIGGADGPTAIFVS